MTKRLNKETKWLIISIPVIFIFSSILHFIYEWTGEIKLIGLFVPVNESVWEHLKLLLIPIIAWWFIFYYINRTKMNIDKNRWFLGCLVSLLSSMLFMLAFFYTYTGAFGIESLFLDILDAFLSICFGQLLGAHIYNRSKGIDWIISVSLIIIIVAIFAWFTINPPELPIFLDSQTGKYGY